MDGARLQDGSNSLLTRVLTKRRSEPGAEYPSQKDAPSPKTYGSPVAAEVAEADKAIQAIPVKPSSTEIVPVAELYDN